MTYESSFTRLHGERTSTISGFFVQDYVTFTNFHSSEFVSIDQNRSRLSDMSLDFLPSPVKILACCNQGLMFCVSERPRSPHNHRIFYHYVCKPSTKQWQIIPNPKTKYQTERTAIMVMKLKPLHYKIVRFSTSRLIGIKENYYLWCEVFDSDLWSWKTVEEVKLSELLHYTSAKMAKGAAHWLTHHNCLLSYDLEKEDYVISRLPEPLHKERYTLTKLLEYGGSIAIACIKDSMKNKVVDLWVMERGRWKKKKSFDIGRLPAAFYNTDIAVTHDCDQVEFHNLKTHTSKVIKLGNFAYGVEIFPYQSDLELLPG